MQSENLLFLEKNQFRRFFFGMPKGIYMGVSENRGTTK